MKGGIRERKKKIKRQKARISKGTEGVEGPMEQEAGKKMGIMCGDGVSK